MTETTHLDVHFVTAQHYRNVLAHPLQVAVPVRNVLIRDPGGHVEHDDTALSLDVITIPKTAELFLSCGIPDVEADGTEVGEEVERVDFHTESCWLSE